MEQRCKRFDIETQLTAWAAELLHAPGVDAQTDLLELGLASLSAVHLKVLIEEEWKIELPLAAVFNCRSLAELIAEIQRRLEEPSELLTDTV